MLRGVGHGGAGSKGTGPKSPEPRCKRLEKNGLPGARDWPEPLVPSVGTLLHLFENYDQPAALAFAGGR
jgi:hypothetical protein